MDANTNNVINFLCYNQIRLNSISFFNLIQKSFSQKFLDVEGIIYLFFVALFFSFMYLQRKISRTRYPTSQSFDHFWFSVFQKRLIVHFALGVLFFFKLRTKIICLRFFIGCFQKMFFGCRKKHLMKAFILDIFLACLFGADQFVSACELV